MSLVGVPAATTIPCPVREAARAHGRREALLFEDRRWTWAGLDAEVARWESLLAARGLSRGGRLALLSGSRPEVLFLMWAAARLGAAVVMLNARLTAAELGPLLARAGAGWVVAEARLLDRLPVGADALESLVAEAAAHAVAVRADDARLLLDGTLPWLILFTSGTTGRAKAAVLGLSQMQASARASAVCINGDGPVRWLNTLPLFHIGGLAMAGRCAFDAGSMVLHERFEPAAVSAALDAEAVTHASLVATTLARLLEVREGRPFGPELRAVLIGGGPVPPALLSRALALGLPCLQTYGLTEACSQVTTERPGRADGRTAGEPLPGVELQVVDAEGRRLPLGGVGEVEVRGPTLMAGYLEDALEDSVRSAAAFRDGWFRTRDMGVLDATGRLRILSRRSDLIVRGGENVYPAEVESVLLEHPRVVEAAVLPERDVEWGQVPVAVVVLREGRERSATAEEELLTFVRERLARFKVPIRCVVRDTLPRNAMNKVDRNALRRLTGIEPQ